MANINFANVSVQQIVAMADGLMLAGQHQMAATLYERALADAKGGRGTLLTKLGLARQPSRDTPALMALTRDLEAITFNLFVGQGLATWRKTLTFADDARFLELANKHAALLPQPNWHWNLQVALWAVEQAREVAGDYVELGVFKGHTTLFCAEYVGFQDWPKRWRLYDTFEGIPDDQVDAGWTEVNRDVYKGTFSFEEVRDRFADFPNIEVIQGRVPEVLDREPDGPIAFLHVDLNNATAEIAALERLFPRVARGGVILFDDYAWAVSRAQYVAEREWLAGKGLKPLVVPTGQAVVVKL